MEELAFGGGQVSKDGGWNKLGHGFRIIMDFGLAATDGTWVVRRYFTEVLEALFELERFLRHHLEA